MIPFRQGHQLFDNTIASIKRERRIKEKYGTMSRDELRQLISDYESRSAIIRIFYRIFELPEYEEYRIARNVMREKVVTEV